jgi:hypothetical protein
MKLTLFKTILMLIAIVGLSACSHIPSLGPGEVSKVWHVHPDDMAQFRTDQARCSASATGLRNADLASDACLQRIGYKLEVVSQ